MISIGQLRENRDDMKRQRERGMDRDVTAAHMALQGWRPMYSANPSLMKERWMVVHTNVCLVSGDGVQQFLWGPRIEKIAREVEGYNDAVWADMPEGLVHGYALYIAHHVRPEDS